MNDLNAIERRRKQWIAAVNTGSVDDYLVLLTDDVVWFPPDQPAVRGKDGFREWIAPFMEAYDYDFWLTQPAVTVAGGWAVERGAFESTMTSTADGQSASHSGRYLVLWRRTPDDLWYIERYLDETQIPNSVVP